MGHQKAADAARAIQQVVNLGGRPPPAVGAGVDDVNDESERVFVHDGGHPKCSCIKAANSVHILATMPKQVMGNSYAFRNFI